MDCNYHSVDDRSSRLADSFINWSLASLVSQGGIYVVQLFDTYAAPISILLVVFLEAVAVNWIYGKL